LTDRPKKRRGRRRSRNAEERRQTRALFTPRSDPSPVAIHERAWLIRRSWSDPILREQLELTPATQTRRDAHWGVPRERVPGIREVSLDPRNMDSDESSPWWD
jgi:hypothetical protein